MTCLSECPALAGMIRVCMEKKKIESRVPRVSGDDPSSPRKRG